MINQLECKEGFFLVPRKAFFVGDRFVYIGFKRERKDEELFCDQPLCEFFKVFDIKSCKFTKQISLDLGYSLRNSFVSPQLPKLVFLREDVVLLNLPTYSTRQLVIVKFNRQGNSDHILRIEGTSNLTTFLDIDWSRDILDVRNHPYVVDRFFGLECESSSSQGTVTRRFSTWRDSILQTLGY